MKFIKKYLEDILVFSGLSLIVIATFFISKIAGIYALGLILFSTGIYFSKYPL